MYNPLISVVERLEGQLIPRSSYYGNGRRTKFEKAGSYPYIPLDLHTFVRQLEQAKALSKVKQYPSFVDVGSGIGTKVLMAQMYGFDGHGVEINSKYAAIAEKLVPRRTTVADALKYDFSTYDIIYFYCPFHNYEKEKALEQHLVATAKPGALFIANLKMNERLWHTTKLVKAVANSGGVIFQRTKVKAL